MGCVIASGGRPGFVFFSTYVALVSKIHLHTGTTYLPTFLTPDSSRPPDGIQFLYQTTNLPIYILRFARPPAVHNLPTYSIFDFTTRICLPRVIRAFERLSHHHADVARDVARRLQ